MQANLVPVAVVVVCALRAADWELARHKHITVRCPACNATYVLAMPRIPKFAGTVHETIVLLKATWGLCGHHPAEISVAH